MLDVFLLKVRLQIEQRSTVLVELLGIRLRPPDSDNERLVRMLFLDEGKQVYKAGLFLVSAWELACGFQEFFFLLRLQCAGHHTCEHRVSSAKCVCRRGRVHRTAAGLAFAFTTGTEFY